MRWHAHHHTEGTGHLYQGRFKTFPIEEDEHLLAVLRHYVERNALGERICVSEQKIGNTEVCGVGLTAATSLASCLATGRLLVPELGSRW